jgi:predicted metal-dependent HD superfamily phosphohydrolase
MRASAESTEFLSASWQRAWRGIGTIGNGETIFQSLLAAYSESHRHYHTLQHLTECLSEFERVQTLANEPSAVECALWFHDAIYDVHAHDNEARSGDWARAVLTDAGAPKSAIETVVDLILATAHRVLPETADAKLLVDMDLSILGAPAARFAEYEQQIRGEYAFVPASIFADKRGEILQSFLDREQIYSTPVMYAKFEGTARTNLRRAIESGWR